MYAHYTMRSAIKTRQHYLGNLFWAILAGMALFLICIAAGVAAGLLAGLLGIGGGLIVVPLMLAVGSSPHMAIGSGLAAMACMTLVATLSHIKRGSISLHKGKFIVFGAIGGAVFGPFIALQLSNEALTFSLAIFQISLGLYFLLKRNKPEKKGRALSPPLLALAGAGIALLGSMLGVGGGMLTTSLLHSYGISIRKAIGTAALVSFSIVTIGTIAFFVAGGKIDLGLFIPLVGSACAAAPFGAKLTHILPELIVKRLFSLLLIGIGLSLALNLFF
jgi:hypothetical protein